MTFYRRKNLHLCSQAGREGGNDIKGAPPRPICQRYFPGIYFGLFMRSHFSGKEEGGSEWPLCDQALLPAQFLPAVREGCCPGR